MFASITTDHPKNGSVSTFPKSSSATDKSSAEDVKPTFIIRHAEHDDSEALHTLLTDPQVVYWTAELPFAPQSDIHKMLKRSSSDRYVLIASNGSEVVGMIVLTVCATPRMRHIGQISSVVVRSDYQGYGIGSQLMQTALDLADNWLNLLRLELLVYNDNEAAIKLYGKYGFQTEGRLQSIAFRAGQYADGLLMARLRVSGCKNDSFTPSRESSSSTEFHMDA